jgi:membrane protease YdiL (CAAX protease family)
MRGATPPSYAVACAGLSAFGPLVAALALGGRRIVSRWRANPIWILAALFTPMAVNVVTTAIYVALFRAPVEWLHLPSTPEQIAALVVFPLGEELGWRGFAHPRIVDRYGLVKGSLLLGAIWGVWHLAYSVTPEAGRFDAVTFAMTVSELPFYAVVVGWFFERTKRSMLVALAIHAGAHLDHLEPAARADLRLHATHLAVLMALSLLVARRTREASASPL